MSEKSLKHLKYNKNSAVTIDTKHSEFLKQFSEDEGTIDMLKSKIAACNRLMSANATTSVEERLELTDQILAAKKNIREIKHKKKKYLLDNSNLIFEYFENKKNISTTTVTSKSKLIQDFFKISDPDHPEPENPVNTQNIVLKYLSNISDDFLDVNNFVYQSHLCQICHRGELIPLEEDGLLVCNMCSRTTPYLIETEKSSYKDPPKEVSFYAYRRINHFKEILAQFQGKESTQIPPDVIMMIKLQMKKERITLDQMTNEKTKDILKKFGYSKYYEHIPFIKDKLGIKPPIMSPELEETLCNLFVDIQPAYSKFCPDDRVNFLHYYYTAYKLCELLGETSYLKHFPMLKDPEKRMEQDIIWKKICKEMNWEFKPTF